MALSRCVLANFELYQKSKLTFLQAIYDFCLKKDFNVDQLVELNIVRQILPLLEDETHLQSLAFITTAKLCTQSKVITQGILNGNVFTRLSKDFEQENKIFKRNFINLIKCMSKHSAIATELFHQTNGVLKSSLQDLDMVLVEMALSTLTNMSNHSKVLAQCTLDMNILPSILISLQQPINLAVEATHLIRSYCKQSKEQTSFLIKNEVLEHLANNVQCNDGNLIKSTLICMSEIAKHSLENSEKLMNPKIICKAILYTSHPDTCVKRSAATFLMELCKHNDKLCKIIVQHGGLAGLINLIATAPCSLVKLPAIMTIGYMAAQSEHLALAIIQSNGLEEIAKLLNEKISEGCLSATLWTLEQISKHSAAHVNYLKDTNVFGKLLQLYLSPKTCSEIQSRCLSALTNTIDKCMDMSALELLLYNTPSEVLLTALKQLCKIFSVDPSARRVFVSTGGLKKVQALDPSPDSELSEIITLTNSFFPEDIVRYYSQKYPEELLSKVEQFTPQLPENLICAKSSASTIYNDDPEWSVEC